MPYCNAGNSPTIKYQFQGQGIKTYKSNLSPIEVITKEIPIDGTSNYKKDGFLGKFRADNCSAFECKILMKDFEIYQPNPSQAATLYYIPCGSTTWARDSNGDRVRFTLNRGWWDSSGWVGIDYSQTCTGTNKQRCSIQVQYNGLTIFQDQGNCPVSFTVTCGNCPPGTEEHKINTYPGYCCFDCQSILAEIKAITRGIRG